MKRNEKIYRLAIGVKDFKSFENLLDIVEEETEETKKPVKVQNNTNHMVEYIKKEIEELKNKRNIDCHTSGQLYALELLIAEDIRVQK